MEYFDLTNVILYCTFGIFVYYQQLNAKNFQGSSQILGLVLSLFSFAGMIVGVIFLIYYGYSVVWWAPIVLFIIGMISNIFGVLLEKLLGSFNLSVLGFLVWPICTYFMFQTIPS